MGQGPHGLCMAGRRALEGPEHCALAAGQGVAHQAIALRRVEGEANDLRGRGLGARRRSMYTRDEIGKGMGGYRRQQRSAIREVAVGRAVGDARAARDGAEGEGILSPFTQQLCRRVHERAPEISVVVTAPRLHVPTMRRLSDVYNSNI